MVGVPVMTPPDDSERPGGSEPLRIDQPVPEMVAPPPDPEVVAAKVIGVMAEPESTVGDCGVTETTLSTVHENGLVDAVAPAESVAVTTTDEGVLLPVVGVPVISPVDELMERPAGRPVAE